MGAQVILLVLSCTDSFISVQDLKKALQMTEEAFTKKYKAPKPEHKDTNIVFAGYKSVKSSAALEIAHKLGFKK